VSRGANELNPITLPTGVSTRLTRPPDGNPQAETATAARSRKRDGLLFPGPRLEPQDLGSHADGSRIPRRSPREARFTAHDVTTKKPSAPQAGPVTSRWESSRLHSVLSTGLIDAQVRMPTASRSNFRPLRQDQGSLAMCENCWEEI